MSSRVIRPFGQGWWALACFLIPATLVWFWGSADVEAVPNHSRDEWILDLFFRVYGTVAAVIAAMLAAVGALRNPPLAWRSPAETPRGGFETRS
jgi:hypothetical protein